MKNIHYYLLIQYLQLICTNISRWNYNSVLFVCFLFFFPQYKSSLYIFIFEIPPIEHTLLSIINKSIISHTTYIHIFIHTQLLTLTQTYIHPYIPPCTNFNCQEKKNIYLYMLQAPMAKHINAFIHYKSKKKKRRKKFNLF